MPKTKSKKSKSAFDLAAIEERTIFAALKHTRGHAVKAAKLLGIGKTTLYRRINKYKRRRKK
jgi:transcriptional regulator of acetoin/glycerol metabolism